MTDILKKIKQAEAGEIGDIFLAALLRYRELYPGWDIQAISIDKAEDRSQQLDRMAEMIERMREQ